MRKNRDAVILPFRSIQSCVIDSGFHYTFVQNENGSFSVKTPEGEIEFSNQEFENTMLPFFTEACSFIQLAKRQTFTTEKTALVFQFRSLKSLLDSKISAQASKLITSVIEKVFRCLSSSKKKPRRSMEQERPPCTSFSTTLLLISELKASEFSRR